MVRRAALHPHLAGIAVLGLCLFSCSTPFYSAAPRRIPADHFGMAHGGFTVSPEEYALLDELGAVWIRRTFDWEDIEPAPGQWNFEEWDAYVDGAGAAGKKILATLAYDVGWIYGEAEPRRHIIPEKIPHFLQYVETVVRRYRGRIGAYEIWNEPNNPFYFWEGSDEDFFALSAAAAAKIKEIDPAAKVAAGSCWLVPKKFIRGMFEAGAMENADILSFHPYGASPRAVLRMYDRLARIAAEYRFAGEIWVTEVGFPTRGVYWGGINEDNYPEYIVKTLAGLAARGVRVTFWYEVFDKYNRGGAPSLVNPSPHFGLAYPDYTRKKGAAAFALAAGYIAGREYRPEFPGPGGPGAKPSARLPARLPAAVTALYFRGDAGDTDTDAGGDSALILWNDRGKTPVRVTLPGSDRRLHDIVTGTGRPVPETAELTLDKTPLILTWREAPGSVPAVSPGK
jgi:hypothetical protein